MPKHRKLNCVELRVHLCDRAQKITSTCLTCASTCPRGEEYAMRFLRQGAGNQAKRDNYLEALTKAYIKHREDSKVPLSKIVPITASVGITTTAALRQAWAKEYGAMRTYAAGHGMTFPNEMKTKLFGWERRVEAYRTRYDRYTEMLSKGMTWREISRAEGLKDKSAYSRYVAAKHVLEEDAERKAIKNGLMTYEYGTI